MFKFLLLPLSFIYGSIIAIRNKLFDYGILKTHEFRIPIISIGNITVGGTGKTPHVEFLVDLLKEQFKIAVLSRGYKRKSKGFVLADENATCGKIGDEPKQIKKKFPAVNVAVMADRVKGINKLCNLFPDLEILLLDDAFQHRHVKPGLSILLINYNMPLGEDHLLPYGNLRENPIQRKRANIIIVTKTPKNLKPIDQRIIYKKLNIYPYQNLYFTTIEYGALKPVFNTKQGNIKLTESSPKQFEHIIIVSGIANTQLLTEYLKEFAEKTSHLKYPDHYNFKAKDLKKITDTYTNSNSKNKIIITTEKDAMRLCELRLENKDLINHLYYLPMKVKFLHDEKENFSNLIVDYVKKNKRNFRLYKK